MPLPDELVAKLSAPGIDGAVVAVTDGGDRLTARVDEASALAVSLFELRLTTDRLAGASIDRVKRIAEKLTERVTYLLEPIQPIEADDEACVVQMRSTKPDQRSGAATYYEVLVKTGGAISLRRYEKPKGGLRREIAMNLTLEVIGRVAEDFLASVS